MFFFVPFPFTVNRKEMRPEKVANREGGEGCFMEDYIYIKKKKGSEAGDRERRLEVGVMGIELKAQGRRLGFRDTAGEGHASCISSTDLHNSLP